MQSSLITERGVLSLCVLNTKYCVDMPKLFIDVSCSVTSTLPRYTAHLVIKHMATRRRDTITTNVDGDEVEISTNKLGSMLATDICFWFHLAQSIKRHHSGTPMHFGFRDQGDHVRRA